MLTKEAAMTFGSLGFLLGLIVGLASCAPDACVAQPVAMSVEWITE